MQILCVSNFDNGGQLINLTNALNTYTEHDVRCITVKESYLKYETDIRWSEWEAPMHKLELRDLLADTEFFIFSELVPSDSPLKQILADLGLYRKVTQSNTIIRTAGSFRTMNTDKLLLAWIRFGWMFAGPYSDWFISGRVGRVAPVNYICPIDKILEKQKRNDDKVRICFAPTSAQKGVHPFSVATNELLKKFDNVEVEIITGKSWAKAIQIKATCDITFDQFMLTHYANSSIESMYLEHLVLSNISPWCKLLHPDLPVIPVNNENELYDALAHFVENPELIGNIGKASKEYVMHWHHPNFVATQWANLIEHVSTMGDDR